MSTTQLKELEQAIKAKGVAMKDAIDAAVKSQDGDAKGRIETIKGMETELAALRARRNLDFDRSDRR